jgi:hypothetical protein
MDDERLAFWQEIADQGSAYGECSGQDLRELLARLNLERSRADAFGLRLADVLWAHNRIIAAYQNGGRPKPEDVEAMNAVFEATAPMISVTPPDGTDRGREVGRALLANARKRIADRPC